MGIEDSERANVRASMRAGWPLNSQRKHYQRALEAAQARLKAIEQVAAEGDAALRHSEEP